jgi:polyphosphate glucokinase
MSSAPGRRKRRRAAAALRVLGMDIGGSYLKAAVVDATGRMLTGRLKLNTPDPCPPKVMVRALLQLVRPLTGYNHLAIGFPGVVRGGRVLTAPHWDNSKWANFALASTLSQRLGDVPARLINDAEMQGLAVIRGRGLELVLTLGTGAGTGLFRDGQIMPHLELAQHPLHKGDTYNDYVGNAARKSIGRKRWNKRVAHTIDVPARAAQLRSSVHRRRQRLQGQCAPACQCDPGVQRCRHRRRCGAVASRQAAAALSLYRDRRLGMLGQ